MYSCTSLGADPAVSAQDGSSPSGSSQAALGAVLRTPPPGLPKWAPTSFLGQSSLHRLAEGLEGQSSVSQPASQGSAHLPSSVSQTLTPDETPTPTSSPSQVSCLACTCEPACTTDTRLEQASSGSHLARARSVHLPGGMSWTWTQMRLPN